ncbi:hypothetical protein [Photobacterium sp. 1_MG-2023]|uniref:hypothetical protein n=1 Tax=Photobacterium sp. 1_MG-2023 TaxID=3062646 RepID=UPI0026E34221|nr:hypothetical protein [Photobacterium sp. 1_MG-2023]MDO6707706.1 hypothetical protein [Photobacterium sp. 1_MG-2023]
MITIVESGVHFGPFNPSQIYQVEKSATIQGISGIKACEFIWWTNEQKLILVEAKASVPSSTKNIDRFNEYFHEIFEKFDNSLQALLTGSTGHSVHVRDELSADIRAMNWRTSKITFYLVIPEAPKAYLPDLTDKLKQVLYRQCKLWRANAMVINKEMAQQIGLIQHD